VFASCVYERVLLINLCGKVQDKTQAKTSKQHKRQEKKKEVNKAKEIGGRKDGLEPTRYNDWEKSGRCIDF